MEKEKKNDESKSHKKDTLFPKWIKSVKENYRPVIHSLLLITLLSGIITLFKKGYLFLETGGYSGGSGSGSGGVTLLTIIPSPELINLLLALINVIIAIFIIRLIIMYIGYILSLFGKDENGKKG